MTTRDDAAHDDLLESLAAADVLETFRALPEVSRRQFEEWIEMAADRTAYWRRIEIFVTAMRFAPRLASPTTEKVPDTRDR